MIKRLVLALMMVSVASMCFAQNYPVCLSSGQRAADAAIVTRGGVLCGVIVGTDGTNNATVVVYDDPDGTDAADEIVPSITVVGADYVGGGIFPVPIKFDDGIYVNVTGVGAFYTVYYNWGLE